MSRIGFAYEDRPDPELVRLRDEHVRLMNAVQDRQIRERNDREKVRLRAENEYLREVLNAPALPAPTPLVLPAPRLEIATLQARHEP